MVSQQIQRELSFAEVGSNSTQGREVMGIIAKMRDSASAAGLDEIFLSIAV